MCCQDSECPQQSEVHTVAQRSLKQRSGTDLIAKWSSKGSKWRKGLNNLFFFLHKKKSKIQASLLIKGLNMIPGFHLCHMVLCPTAHYYLIWHIKKTFKDFYWPQQCFLPLCQLFNRCLSGSVWNLQFTSHVIRLETLAFKLACNTVVLTTGADISAAEQNYSTESAFGKSVSLCSFFFYFKCEYDPKMLVYFKRHTHTHLRLTDLRSVKFVFTYSVLVSSLKVCLRKSKILK